LKALLTALQLGDSFFPSGSTAQSWGLEELRGAGRIPDAGALEEFLGGQLEGRWASADRVATLAAHAAAAALDDVGAIDEHVERSTPAAGWRLASRRGGRALLAAHAELGTPGARAYAERVDRDQAPGHACVVHGLVAAGSGLGAGEAAALSGYGVAVAVVSAALRLGIVGHRDAQRLLAGQRDRIARLAVAPAPALLDAMSAWVPEAEIAAMRHEARRGRLFAS
jgi:urease accessory protein